MATNEEIKRIARMIKEDIDEQTPILESSIDKSYTFDELNNVESFGEDLDFDQIEEGEPGGVFKLSSNAGGTPEGGNFEGGIVTIRPSGEEVVLEVPSWGGLGNNLDELYSRLIHITGFDDLIGQGKTPEEADKIMDSWWGLRNIDIGPSSDPNGKYRWTMRNCKMVPLKVVLLPDGTTDTFEMEG